MTESASINAIAPRRGLRNQKRRIVRTTITGVQFNHLLRAAEHRGIAPAVLVDRIVAAVLDHNLIKAVLDDDA